MNKTLFKSIIVLALFLGTGTAQGEKYWEKTFGGTYTDLGYSVQQTTDGGFIIAGQTLSFGAGSSDVYLIKTDGDGNELWSKTFGGSGGDSGKSVQQTTDGGFIIAGQTLSFGAGSTDVYLIKTDGDGNELWSKTFGGSGGDSGKSVQQTTDGGYIIAGYANYNEADSEREVYLIKTDADGNELWSKNWGGSAYDIGYSVQQTTDGGYIIAGQKDEFMMLAQYFAWLIKTDADGNELWSKNLTVGSVGNDTRGYSVQQTTDGGYIITGDTIAPYVGESNEVYLIKTDADGNELWSKTFGGSGGDSGKSVQQTTDGGYIIAGYANYHGWESEVYLIKTNADGNELWSKTLTFGGSGGDAGQSVQQTTDGGYIIAGYANYDETHSEVCLIYYKPETTDSNAPIANSDDDSPCLISSAAYGFRMPKVKDLVGAFWLFVDRLLGF